MPKKTAAKKTAAKDLVLVATSLLDLKEIKMKDDHLWRIKAMLKTELPQSFREYTMRLSLNEQPFELRIEDLEKRYAQVSAEPKLFNKDKELRAIDDEIAEVKEELEAALAEYKVMDFGAVLEELKYKGDETLIVAIIPAEAIADLNDNRNRLRNYKVELLRDPANVEEVEQA